MATEDLPHLRFLTWLRTARRRRRLLDLEQRAKWVKRAQDAPTVGELVAAERRRLDMR